MFAFLDPPEIILILVVVLVLFGGAQLPKLAKNLGKAQKEFKDGLADGQKAADDAKASEKAADDAKS
jgi:sec-independent protein translocase protein TatA